MRKTKIICTLGPSTDNEDIIKSLILNGMNIVRINVSHGTLDDHKKRIDMVKRVRKALNCYVALLLDTKGPEIRTGKLKDASVFLENDQSYVLTTRKCLGDNKICSITFKNLPQYVLPGTKILIDDGLIELKVNKIDFENIFCTVINGGDLLPCKGINVPGIKTPLPFIGPSDTIDLKFAVEQDFDFVAASFTRCKKDLNMLKLELEKNNCSRLKIIAKIENLEGLKNVDDIINISDGIMVGRGDLGVEIPIEEIPIIQKYIIKKVISTGKQVIVATQMLESMIKNPRPTRAECTDVANAIYDGTSAIMLSGETASGKYPISSLKMMSKIAERAEKEINYKSRLKNIDLYQKFDIATAISHATCTTAHDLSAKAIITITKTGRTAKMISGFKPDCIIIGGSSDETVLRQMSLFWGVIPLAIKDKISNEEIFDYVIKTSLKRKVIKKNDIIVITAGVFGGAGYTNLIKVHIV
ncbi:MAG: pyruvate kinase [Oscillospiraceae bacterium]|jgi:pyruvate kinase|nr:pyruvate kinase [Oscillospiraceae bacterium]